MPRSRSRSRSPTEQEHRLKENSSARLPKGAKSISEEDYFQRSAEFRKWLKEEKDRYFDEVSSEKARSYFRKFVKEWNRGKLSRSYYAGITESDSTAISHTAYRWSFANKASRAEQDKIEGARQSVRSATDVLGVESEPGPSRAAEASRSIEPPRKVQGPSMPSAADILLAKEDALDQSRVERGHKRKRERREDKERIEDMVGPKESGRQGMLEKKKVQREGDRAFREAKDDTFAEIDESTLMGGGDSFQARIAQRDAARKRMEEKRASVQGEKRQRINDMKEKDKATMDMFMQMARERFG